MIYSGPKSQHIPFIGNTLATLASLGLTTRNENGKSVLNLKGNYELSRSQLAKINAGKAHTPIQTVQNYGTRKKPVLAIMKDGSKKLMTLKNALKKNLDFTTI